MMTCQHNTDQKFSNISQRIFAFFNRSSVIKSLFYIIRSYHLVRDIHRVLQTIQMKLILLCVWAEPAVLGSTKTALKFKYEI